MEDYKRMDFFDVITQRASVRKFTPSEITDDELNTILDAGRRAPSGYNRQPWEFIVVRKSETLERLSHVQSCIGEASAAVCIVMDEEATTFWKEDAAAAIENMLLAVVALGYASLWVEGYVLQQETLVKSIVQVPDNRRVIAVLPIGKPAAPPRQANKKSLSELVFYETYGNR